MRYLTKKQKQSIDNRDSNSSNNNYNENIMIIHFLQTRETILKQCIIDLRKKDINRFAAILEEELQFVEGNLVELTKGVSNI